MSGQRNAANDDLWALLVPHIPDAYEDAQRLLAAWPIHNDELEAKYRKGEAEHGRDWLDKTPEWFAQQMVDECIDLVVYNAMLRVRMQRRAMAAPFLTNRDPGDEADA